MEGPAVTSILIGAGGSSLPLFRELDRPSSTPTQQPLTPLCALLSAVDASLPDSNLSLNPVTCTKVIPIYLLDKACTMAEGIFP